MKRVYKKKPWFDKSRIGLSIFTLFVVFVAFKILTPPSQELARLPSPDGSKTARLRRFYYTGEPSYKIYYREADKLVWLNLLYLPSYTNIPHQTAKPAVEWSADSERLDFIMGGTSIWHHDFE